ncbi:hypothetical protein H2200_003189 [Cladophialophora chaetospira]|uniref:FAD-binding PCMH-type domain-containing protein n=1 Tax=Cladophialophora chaetospira TaxID=386627 RepID=A0AA38XGZ3_9EURO|nr:hypothetical protein H2200_003189 [Cladophialophora chaetospira]
MTPNSSDLTGLKSKLPDLRIYTPSNADFEAVAALYVGGIPSRPLAIVRPRSEEEVGAVVEYANEKSIPLAVRVGGHDLLGRSGPNQALVVDLRDIKYVDIVDDGQAAIIGGGVLAQDLADTLERTGHATAFGASSTVGYVGWATHGGYGLFSGLYGLGVDQILGARVVDYRGEIFHADEELLYGIRGAGSAFGVIVSMKIKIYKLEKVLASALVYSIGAVENDLDDFLRKYQKLLDQGIPRELGLIVGVANFPKAGKALFCSFMWASEDLVAGKVALAKMQELGPIVMDTVAEVTISTWLRNIDKNTPAYGVYSASGPANVLVPSFDNQVRDILVKFTKGLPADPATLWVENHAHGAALEPKLPCSFGYRMGHIMIEIIGTSVVEEMAKQSGDWVVSFDKAARALPQTLDGGYIVLLHPSVPSKLCYQGHWDRLQRLKAKFDPHNMFAFSVTGLDGKI